MNKNEIKQIVDLYSAGKTSREIGQILGYTHSNILYYLKKNNITRRLVRHTIEIPNDNLTEELAYWLGFILADGCIHDDGRFSIALQSNDKNHLVKLQTYLKCTHPVSIYRNGRYTSCALHIRSNKLCSLFAKYKIYPRKSLIAVVDERLKYNRHFWRGVIDGDGSIINKNYIALKLVGSLDVCGAFADFVASVDLNHKKPNVLKHKNIFAIELHGCKRAISIISHLYDNSSIYLDRKHKKYFDLKYYQGIHKLDYSSASKIRDLLKDMTIGQVATMYKVAYATISDIKHNRTWRQGSSVIRN